MVPHTEPLAALHLCSGYGGFELGLRHAGIPARTVAHVERDSYAAATLVARMEEARLDQAPIWSDLTTFDGSAWRGRVDLITAGFPCQPFSAAGKQRGVDDDRWLWPAIMDIIRDVGPRYVILENVTGVIKHGLPYVLADLAEIGFDAEWGCLSAAAVGAPHKRERFWLLAYADGDRFCGLGRIAARDERDADGCDVSTPHVWPPTRNDADGWADYIAAGGPQPSVRRSPDGAPRWLADRLHLGGNGLVPQCAAHAITQLAARLGDTNA